MFFVRQLVCGDVEAQERDAIEEGAEHDLQFQAGQVLSEALVDAVAEGETPSVAAVDVDLRR